MAMYLIIDYLSILIAIYYAEKYISCFKLGVAKAFIVVHINSR
jgi:hypothetical protein